METGISQQAKWSFLRQTKEGIKPWKRVFRNRRNGVSHTKQKEGIKPRKRVFRQRRIYLRPSFGERAPRASGAVCEPGQIRLAYQTRFDGSFPHQTKRERQASLSFVWCGKRESNPYGKTTRPSNVRVCQFRHSRNNANNYTPKKLLCQGILKK